MTAVSPILGIPQVSPSQSLKEQTINTADAKLEAAANDVLVLTFSGSDITLTTAQFASAALFKATGNSAPFNLIVPTTSDAGNSYRRMFTVVNTGTADLTVKTAAVGGVYVDVAPNSAAICFSDGTDITRTGATSAVSGGTGAMASESIPSAGVVISNGTHVTSGTLSNGLTLNSGTIGIGLLGDVTIDSGGTATLAATGVTAGSYGDSTHFAAVTVDAKGRITAAASYALGTMAFQAANSVAITGGSITGLSSPTVATDAATKGYVDGAIQGLAIKGSCQWATTSALPTNTYSNGTSGVGATLTATANGALTVDGSAVSAGERILVKNESTASHNGIYVVTQAGDASNPYILTRSVDNDSSTEFMGAFVAIAEGTANFNTLWLCSAVGSITVGTTAVNFTQLNSATSLSATAPITIAANVISHATSGVSAGTYGDSGHVAQFTVDTYGHVTSVSSVAISTGGTAGTIVATGTSQATAALLTYENNIITSGSGGVRLDAAAGRARVINRSGASLALYPPTGGQIEAQGANTGVAVVNGGVAYVISLDGTQFYVG